MPATSGAHVCRLAGREYNTYVLLGDGELHEGQVWEAAMSAAHYRASRLIAIIDRNRYSLDGTVDEVIGVEPLGEKWRAFGWNVVTVDGHDVGALRRVLRAASEPELDAPPTVVIAHRPSANQNSKKRCGLAASKSVAAPARKAPISGASRHRTRSRKDSI